MTNISALLGSIRKLRAAYTDKENVGDVIVFLGALIQNNTIQNDLMAITALAAHVEELHRLNTTGKSGSATMFREVQEALCFADMIVCRRPMLGKVYDLRSSAPGTTLPDGNCVEKCPMCWEGALILDGPDHPHAIHKLQVESLTGFRIIEACCVQDEHGGDAA